MLRFTLFIILTGNFATSFLVEDGIAQLSELQKLSITTIEFAKYAMEIIKGSDISNGVVSSLANVLGYSPLLYGSGDGTRKAVFEALRFNYSCKDPEEAMAFIGEAASLNLDKIHPGYNSHCVYLVDSSTKIEPEFSDKVKKYPYIEMIEVDFKLKREAVKKATNSYVKNITGGVIKEFFSKPINPYNRMLLIHVSTFNGKFKNKFDKKRNIKRTFNGVSKRVKATFMTKNDQLYHFENSLLTLVRLEYEHGFEFIILLPKAENGLPKVLEAFNHRSFKEWHESATLKTVNLTLVKYKSNMIHELYDFECRSELRPVFSTKSNYSKISKCDYFRVTETIHRPNVRWNEVGTDIKFARSLRSIDVEVVTDHPFAYVIYDPKKELVVFYGVVETLSKHRKARRPESN